jgi:ATP-dependent DNA helicase RecQ
VVQCQIEEMKQRNFKLKTAKANFIVYWQKENTKQEVKIVLPELYFERTNGYGNQ